jgi:hypothetical protein
VTGARQHWVVFNALRLAMCARLAQLFVSLILAESAEKASERNWRRKGVFRTILRLTDAVREYSLSFSNSEASGNSDFSAAFSRLPLDARLPDQMTLEMTLEPNIVDDLFERSRQEKQGRTRYGRALG